MLDFQASAKALERLFRRFRVADLGTLYDALDTRSRMSVFRRLRQLGYLSSYTHAGRYYTLADIPRFDEYGLWFYEGVGFSRSGSLKATAVNVVETSPSGYTHMEMKRLLQVRVHNTLLGLVHAGLVGREQIEKVYLYVSARHDRACLQVAKRKKQLADLSKPTLQLPTATIIEVLVEAIQAAQISVSPTIIAERLAARGLELSATQVQEVLGHYGMSVEKKTKESRLPPLRP